MKVLVVNCSPVKNGATAEIVKLVTNYMNTSFEAKSICIDDYKIELCKGCRSCHKTAKCIQQDDVTRIMNEFEQANVIISVTPSYWADIPGQYKVFIDRCTPWCNTHEPHASVGLGKTGYSIALRTGPNMKECNRIIETIEHFYGHLEIKSKGSLGLCSIECKNDVISRQAEIEEFCRKITEDFCYV